MLREEARLTGKDVATRLGWAQSKVSRLEYGKQTATTDDIAAWAQAVRASDEQRDDLIAELRSVRFEYATWQQQLRSGTATVAGCPESLAMMGNGRHGQLAA